MWCKILCNFSCSPITDLIERTSRENVLCKKFKFFDRFRPVLKKIWKEISYIFVIIILVLKSLIYASLRSEKNCQSQRIFFFFFYVRTSLEISIKIPIKKFLVWELSDLVYLRRNCYKSLKSYLQFFVVQHRRKSNFDWK